MRRIAAIVAVTALSLTAFAAPTGAAGRAWELNRRAGRETVIGISLAGRNEAEVGGSDVQRPKFVSVPGSAKGVVPSRAKVITEAALGGVDLSSATMESGDVDGDGDGDLVIGAPFNYHADPPQNGSVVVVPGGRYGPKIGRAYLLGITDGADLGGEVLVDDLDRDGFADVAASWASSVDYETDTYSYAVTVFWGGNSRLSHTRSTTFATPAAFNSEDGSQPHARLQLRAGNFVEDGRREILVVNVGWDPAVSGREVEGADFMLCRVESRSDIPCAATRSLAEPVAAVAVGDFVYHKHTDVVLSEATDSNGNPGALWVYSGLPGNFYGYSGGLVGPETISQAKRGVPGTNQRGDDFGASLAVADLDRDGKHDLAVGAPGEDDDRGRVTLLYGNFNGLGRSGKDRIIDQGTTGVPGTRELGDAFGAEVSLIDVDGNGAADLIAASGGEKAGATIGSVTVVRSNGAGRLAPRSAKVIYSRDVGVKTYNHYEFGGDEIGG